MKMRVAVLIFALNLGVAGELLPAGPIHITNIGAYKLEHVPPVKKDNVLAFLGCLAKSDQTSNAFVSFRGLASKGSATYNVRYTVGQIAGTSGGAGKRSINLAVYYNKDYFILYFAEQVKGGLLIDADTYDLSRDAGRWSMVDGNGGIGTGRAMAAFAAKLDKMDMLRIKSADLPAEPGCIEWE